MKKINKIFSLVFLLFFIRLTISCCDEQVINIKWSDVDFQISNNSVTNTKLDSIEWYDFEIKLTIRFNEIAFNTNYGFADSYGSDCKDYYQAKNKIKTLKIFTLIDYDNIKKAGDDITDYFRSNPINPQDPQLIGLSVAERVAEINNNPIDNDLILRIDKEPSETKEQQFKIEITLDNNDKIEKTTNKLTIIKLTPVELNPGSFEILLIIND